MRYMKTLEEYNIYDIKVGDYVVIQIIDNSLISGSSTDLEKLTDYLTNNIGKIIDKYRNYAGIMTYIVKFYNVSFFVKQYFDDGCIDVEIENIFDVGTVEELTKRYELRQTAKKYNL